MHRLGLGLTLMIAGGTHLSATTLWDQSNLDQNSGIVNQIFSPGNSLGSPADSSYLVDDVTVGGDGWIINSFTGYFQGQAVSATGTALLNIFAEGGTLPSPGDDPTTGIVVNVTYNVITGNLLSGTYAITASGLNIALAPGEYWIGLTPFGPNQFELMHQFSTSNPVVGNPAAWINPGDGLSYGSGWQSNPIPTQTLGDAAFLITGSVVTPEPAPVLGTAGALVALAWLRRRKA